jgi:hypothetical protein
MSPHLDFKDPRQPENEVCWMRLIVHFLRQPTAEEMVALARNNQPQEALATIAAFRNHLANNTRPPQPIADFILEALNRIVAGEKADFAFRLKLRNRSKMPVFYRKKAAYYVLYQVALGNRVEDACERVANHILLHKRLARAGRHGEASSSHEDFAPMDAEELAVWNQIEVNLDLMQKCYREHKQTMLEILNSIK